MNKVKLDEVDHQILDILIDQYACAFYRHLKASFYIGWNSSRAC